ncbi:MAG TPA: heavy metal-binding domain-containing protein [Candidatus Wunengus sp. YC65]|uniref:heavy metal-binding domain-containing protein n=1 Tax=Candidatus Wunengus sp. YC65 TaxID=3367701 RepID=UPI0040270A52
MKKEHKYCEKQFLFSIISVVGASALGTVLLTGCYGSREKTRTETHMYEVAHQHDESKEHHHDIGHMEHMNDVREMLKDKLGADYEKTLPPAANVDVAIGKTIYQQYCAACHGVTGMGDGPASGGLSSQPSDFTDPDHSGYYSDRGRLWIVRNGIHGTPMVGWFDTLGEEGTRQVYSYVQSFREQGKHEDHDHVGIEDVHEHQKGEHDIETAYICPMKHEDSKSDKPGKCPVCGMDLIKVKVTKKEHDLGHNN